MDLIQFLLQVLTNHSGSRDQKVTLSILVKSFSRVKYLIVIKIQSCIKFEWCVHTYPYFSWLYLCGQHLRRILLVNQLTKKLLDRLILIFVIFCIHLHNSAIFLSCKKKKKKKKKKKGPLGLDCSEKNQALCFLKIIFLSFSVNKK